MSDQNLAPRRTTRQTWLRLERAAADNTPPVVDPALLGAVRRWRAVRAELGLARLLDEPWRRTA